MDAQFALFLGRSHNANVAVHSLGKCFNCCLPTVSTARFSWYGFGAFLDSISYPVECPLNGQNSRRSLRSGNITENRCINPINIKLDSRKIDLLMDIAQVQM